MKYELIIRERAAFEIQESFEYYEQQKNGLGVDFKNNIKKQIDYILENPKHFNIVRKSFRQVLVDVFPFLVIYKVEDKAIVVYSVFHTSRNPKMKFVE